MKRLGVRSLTKAAKEEMEILRVQHDGMLRPSHVVGAARKKTSALHDYFEWDIKKAAEMAWLDTASRLIRICVEVIPWDGAEITVRSLVSLPSDRGPDGCYRVLADVLNDKDQRQELLDDVLGQLNHLKNKYRILRELDPVWLAVDQVSKETGGA
jgi:hypothetical protein